MYLQGSIVLTADCGAAVALCDAQEGVGGREPYGGVEEVAEARLQVDRAHGRPAHGWRRGGLIIAILGHDALKWQNHDWCYL